MVNILHGDNLAASRQRLVELVSKAQDQNMEVVRKSASQLSAAVIELAFQSTDLFGANRIVVIEELHSQPVGKKTTELIATVQQAQTQSGTPLVLWEKRSLTPTMLKRWPAATAQEFKTPAVIFTWLDALSGKPVPATLLKKFHQAVDQEGEMICFNLLQRQVRMLIQAKEGVPVAGPPFVQRKLQQQANTFSLPQLLKLHTKLVELDLATKTSGLVGSLTHHLDLLQLAL